jgi:hypothetical protein
MTSSPRHRHFFAAIVIGGMLYGCTVAVHAEWLVDVAAGGAYSSNLTRAQNAPDRRPDWSLPFALSVSRHEVLSGYDGLTFGIDLHGEVYDRYRGLDFVGMGASAIYHRKLALGLTAPYGLIAASVSHDDYRADVRDSNRFDLRIELGRRFNESLDLGAGLTFDRRYAKTDIPIVPGISGAIFDLRGYGAFLRAEQALNDQWLVGARVGVRRGDVESTSQRSRAVFLASDAIADDPAFEDPLLFGYRLRGTTTTVACSLSYALSDRAAINVAYTGELTHAAQDLQYRSRFVNAAFGYRF